MLLRFLGRICGDAVGSAARRLHRDIGDEMRKLSRALYQHREISTPGPAGRLRKNVEDETEKLCHGLWAHRKKILDSYLGLQGVNYILKFPEPEPAELMEFAAEETLKEDAMKWRFEQYLITEHGCKYKTRERIKVWLFDMFKKCAQEVEKRNTEIGGAAFGTDLFWVETELVFRRHRELEDD